MAQTLLTAPSAHDPGNLYSWILEIKPYQYAVATSGYAESDGEN